MSSVGFHFLWALPLVAIMVLVVVVVVMLIVRLASSPPHPFPPAPYGPPAGPPPGPREGPLDILARRFASGEISAEEYQKARDLLQGGGSSS